MGARIPILLLKVAAFLVGAYLSNKLVGHYWYVGPIFGAVVLLWQAESIHDLIRPRSLAFFAASTLIWAFVYWLLDHDHRLLDLPALLGLSDSANQAVAVGSILLPMAHWLLLKVSWKRVLVPITCLYAAWYAIVSLLDSIDFDFNAWINAVSIWQAIYLLCLFVPKPDFHGGWFQKEATIGVPQA